MTVIGKLYKDYIYIQRSMTTDIRPFLVVPPTTDSWAFPKPRTAIRSPWWSCRSPLRHTRSFTATRPAAISWAAGPRAIENAAPIKQSSRSDGTVSRISRFSAAGCCTSDIPVLCLLGYAALLVYGLSQFPFWDWILIKDVIIWVLPSN